ncbi:hypothetical protein D9M72_278690 [compost metagenome]
MLERFWRQAGVHFRLRRAHGMGDHQQHHTCHAQPPMTAEGDQGETGGRGGGSADPPDLALGQIGGGGAGQFRRQAQGWRQGEGSEATQPPQQAMPGAGRAAQAEQPGEDQGEAHGHHQVAAARGQGALPAILRRPGFVAVLMDMGDSRAAVFMVQSLLDRGRLGAFIGFRLENQRGDPQALQQGQHQGRDEAGEPGGLGDALDHGYITQWQGKAALWRVSWAALCTASMCEKPAKYTRDRPTRPAPMASTRRWARVEEEAAEWDRVRLDMEIPSALLVIPADEHARGKRTHERPGFRLAPAHRGLPKRDQAGLRACDASLGLDGHAFPCRFGTVAYLTLRSLTVAGAASDLSEMDAPISRFTSRTATRGT